MAGTDASPPYSRARAAGGLFHVQYREIERCCWCGADTLGGIYRREDPAKLPLHHEFHGDHEQEHP